MIVIQRRRRPGNALGWIIGLLVGAVILGSTLLGGGAACFAIKGDTGALTGLLNIDDGVETTELPGKARAFASFEALAAVTGYAGPGAKLVSIEVALVRADGTLDLEAPFTPKPDVTYTFARELPPHRKGC